jgi:hypothetical protein
MGSRKPSGHGSRPQQVEADYQSSWYDDSNAIKSHSSKNGSEQRRSHVSPPKKSKMPVTFTQQSSKEVQASHSKNATDGKIWHSSEKPSDELPLHIFVPLPLAPQPVLLSHNQAFDFDLPSVDEAAAIIASSADTVDESPTVPHSSKLAIRPAKLKPASKTARYDDDVCDKHLAPKISTSAGNKEDTIEALNAAIPSGFNHSASRTMAKHPSRSQIVTSVSPSSNYTDDNIDLASPTLGDHADVRFVNISQKDRTETSDSRILGTLHTLSLGDKSSSTISAGSLQGPVIQKHAQNDPVAKPLRTGPDVNTIRHAGARGSTTSLPELIRRATRLASNLDRGKTASRLGFEDMLGAAEKGDRNRRVESTYSDVLYSFPAPGMSTTTTHAPSPLSSWPEDEKTIVQQPSRLSQREDLIRKRCCGLSIRAFLVVMIIIILLIAAAVLIPIFTILVPQQLKNSTDLRQCPSSYRCQNGGVSIVDNNACSCVCVDGYTGARCATASDPSCVTTTLHEGDLAYKNATIGSSILPMLSRSQSQFGIPLNASVLLSIFAVNNLSCAGENSLVQFGADVAKVRPKEKKRLFILPGHEDETYIAPIHAHSHNTEKSSGPRDLAIRQPDGITSSGQGIYQATATASLPTNATVASIATSTSPSSTSTSVSMNDNQTAFAQVIVLYVLEQSRAPQTAVDTQQIVEQYFRAGGTSSGNTTLTVMSTSKGKIVVNFAEFCVASVVSYSST